jgi:hypothetical protein
MSKQVEEMTAEELADVIDAEEWRKVQCLEMNALRELVFRAKMLAWLSVAEDTEDVRVKHALAYYRSCPDEL